MPGLVKIGVTQNTPAHRAKELVSTGVPAEFRVDYFCVVYDPYEVEKYMHAQLEACRGRGEWFAVLTTEAVAVVRQSGFRLLDEGWHEAFKETVFADQTMNEGYGASGKATRFGFVSPLSSTAQKFFSGDVMRELISTAAQTAGRGFAETLIRHMKSMSFRKKS